MTYYQIGKRNVKSRIKLEEEKRRHKIPAFQCIFFIDCKSGNEYNFSTVQDRSIYQNKPAANKFEHDISYMVCKQQSR
jgi:hypothetical protein